MDMRLRTDAAKVEQMTENLAKAYDQVFFEGLEVGSRRSASVMVPLVRRLVRPDSVLDVGCGVGSWIAEWVNQGVTDVLGLDGDYVDKSMLKIPLKSFQSMDLQNPFWLGRRFDLAQSLEVAEHLDESCADAFVESLVGHADTILFSAAIPGQRGKHHVNEQWPSYWAKKFSHLGLKPFDIIRPAIWMDQRVDCWYRQNTILFSRESSFEVSDTCIDVVHPEYWKALNAHPPLRRLPAGFAYGMRYRLSPLIKRR
jgi:SAM-dependent methyltransferase